MAGGGIQGGLPFGETDEMGCRAGSAKVRIHELHATLVRLFGLDPLKLAWCRLGRDYRLTDADGKVVTAILA